MGELRIARVSRYDAKLATYASRRTKRASRTHDPLALVANRYSVSHYSPTSRAYYVTHPPSVNDVDGDNQSYEFQGDANGRVNVQSKNAGNARRNTGRIVGNSGNATYGQQANENNANMLFSKKDEVGIDLNDLENDFLLDDIPDEEGLEELNASCIMMERIQMVNNDSDVGPSYDSDFENKVHDSRTSFINHIFAKSNQEHCYLEKTKSIKPTYDDDQIDSNIIFDDLDVKGNSANDE
ncbi:hypothetical protein Tco_0458949 [Tanacetum coccineum]